MGKWDLVDKHYKTRGEMLQDLVAAELHEQCVTFPPRGEDVAWADPAFERRFRSTLPHLPGPDSPMIAFLCQVLDLEIDHDVEEIDRLVHSPALERVCNGAAARETFHYLWRTLLHHLEARAAELDPPLKRAEKHRVVDALRRRAMLVQVV
jgi:hypothetical protein